MFHADGSKIYPRRTRSRRIGPRPNATTHLNKEQLKQLQEAFNVIDQDRDGVISKEDLQTILVSLGQKPTEKEVRDMLNEVPGNVDFARFLSMFASKMGTADPEDLIRNAFTCFDEDCDGVINLDEFKQLLMTMGLRLTEQQVQNVLNTSVIFNRLTSNCKLQEPCHQKKKTVLQNNESESGVSTAVSNFHESIVTYESKLIVKYLLLLL